METVRTVQYEAAQLTRVGVGVAVGFRPLVGGGLLVEVVLRLHQRERMCEEGATANRLVVPQTAVTAALLRAVRQVKRDAPLRLEPRAQNRASHVSALLCPPQTPAFAAKVMHVWPELTFSNLNTLKHPRRLMKVNLRVMFEGSVYFDPVTFHKQQHAH